MHFQLRTYYGKLVNVLLRYVTDNRGVMFTEDENIFSYNGTESFNTEGELLRLVSRIVGGD